MKISENDRYGTKSLLHENRHTILVYSRIVATSNEGSSISEKHRKLIKYPLSPAQATIAASTFLAITRQLIELESYSNPLRILHVFSLRLKKKFSFWVWGFLWVTS